MRYNKGRKLDITAKEVLKDDGSSPRRSACPLTTAHLYPCPEVSTRNIVDMNTLTAERGRHKYTSSLGLISADVCVHAESDGRPL
jgi:hypothetical protein